MFSSSLLNHEVEGFTDSNKQKGRKEVYLSKTLNGREKTLGDLPVMIINLVDST